MDTNERMTAITSEESVEGQTTVLYKDPAKGSKRGMNNTLTVQLSPAFRSRHIQCQEDDDLKWTFNLEDSADLETMARGQFGLFTVSQPTRFFDLSTLVCV